MLVHNFLLPFHNSLVEYLLNPVLLKNYEKAIRSYEQAQEIYPAMRSPKIMIRQIEELMKQQTI